MKSLIEQSKKFLYQPILENTEKIIEFEYRVDIKKAELKRNYKVALEKLKKKEDEEAIEKLKNKFDQTMESLNDKLEQFKEKMASDKKDAE